MTADDKREELKQKIAMGEERLAQRSLASTAREAGENAAQFVKRHPLATIGGAIVVGLAIGAMTKPGRRLGKRGGVFAAMLTDAAIAYGMNMVDQAGDAARTGQERIGELGEVMSDKARDTRRKAGDAVRNLRDRIVH